MLSVLVLWFLFVCQTSSLSVPTDDKTNSEETKIDFTRQLLNQETVIRMNLERKVYNLIRDMDDMKTNMADLKTKMRKMKTNTDSKNKQLKEEMKEAKNVLALEHENSALKAELQLQVNVTTLLSENLDTIKQFQKAQQQLSSAVSSLEVFQKNMSSLRSAGSAEKRVGFTVGVTVTTSGWRGDILVFPQVVTNKENNYNTSTGKFTAPRNGTYVFFVTAVSYSRHGLYLDIVHNGANKVRTMSVSTAPAQTGTNLAVLQLSQGDKVWVRRVNGHGYATDSVPLVTFSGFLL